MPTVLTFAYDLDAEALKQEWLKTGVMPKPTQEYKLDVEKVASNVRELLLAVGYKPYNEGGPFRSAYFDLQVFTASAFAVVGTRMKLPRKIENDDELVDRLMSHVGSFGAAKIQCEWKIAERKAEQARQQHEAETKKRAAALEKEQRAERKRAWIAAHGSERLRKAVALGYDCDELCEQEYVKANYPFAQLDYAGIVAAEDISGPTLSAMELLEAVQKVDTIVDAKIVMVTFPAAWTVGVSNVDDDDLNGPAFEAILFGDKMLDHKVILQCSWQKAKELYDNKVQADKPSAGGEG